MRLGGSLALPEALNDSAEPGMVNGLANRAA